MRAHNVRFLGVMLVLGLVATARADVAPPDACTAPGQPCNNAGASYNQPGTCTTSTCTRSGPGPDGGIVPISYACNLCKAAGTGGSGGGAGGVAGAGGAGGAGGSSSSDAGTTPSSKGSGCCAVAGAGEGSGLGYAAVLLGIVAVLGARRRRAP